eukprot:7625732-Pyramimonas_sp.AAC.1
MGSKVRAVSPMHRRCGSMWSPIFSTLASPMHRRRRWCIADDAARSFDTICSEPIWETSNLGLALGAKLDPQSSTI